MAAVAAEPGAAAASTTAGDGLDYEPEPEEHVVDLEPHTVSEMERCHISEHVEAVQECSQIQVEIRRPDLQAAGKALVAHADGERNESESSHGRLDTQEQPVLMDLRCGDVLDDGETFSQTVVPVNQVSPIGSSLCRSLPSSISDCLPSVLCSLPAQALSEPETGLSPAVDPLSSHPAELECELIGFTQPETEPAAREEAPHETPDPVSAAEESSLEESAEKSCNSDFSAVSSKNSLELPTPSEQSLLSSLDSEELNPLHQSFQTDLGELETKVQNMCGLEPDSTERLVLGSEVRVTLDHIIDDALVVSFRLGEKIFSGVLMDLSKRFGPYGIPINVYPKRDYKDKPESMQLKTETFQSGAEKDVGKEPSDPFKKEPADVSDTCSKNSNETPATPQPCSNPWTLKQPPLFQDGAPYPPPLFIRDTYNQSLPQPLPRKIKRPKRRLYREEPTSIMNAIKLRPRQVLCDKCKGAVVQGDKRETRRGPISDCRSDDAKKRRNDNTTAAAAKRPRSDPRSEEKGRGNDGHKRQGSTIKVSPSSTASTLGSSQVKGAASGSKMLKGVPTTASTANARVQLNAKKVLQSKNVDHSKAREVFKMAKAQKSQKETVTGSGLHTKAITRAAALQEAHQKVHFTRRLQQISGGGPGSNALPPRMRIKPQRYRNEENDSSSCKTPCLEKVPGGGRSPPPKPAISRCTSTRSSSSANQVNTAIECQRSEKANESLLSQAQPNPLPPLESREALVEPEDQEAREDKRETRGSKAGNLVVYMTLNPSKPDSSSTSMCSIDSADDIKSSNSECSSTETFDFPPPGDLRPAPAPGTSSAFAAPSPSAPKDDKKRSKPIKAAVFSKNVTKCVAHDGRTICVGDIVWAKILGFPWWPARILAITVSRKENGLLVRQEARVSWFGSPTTSFLAITQLAPFLESFQSRFDKKRRGLYRKAITEAAKAAKQLTPEVRALLTQFET